MSVQLERLKAEEAELEAQMLGDQSQDPEELAAPLENEDSTTDEDSIVASEEELEAASMIEEIIVQPNADEETEGELDDPFDEGTSDDDEPLEGQPQQPKRTNWKKRFIGLQKSHEATVHAHKREVMELKAKMADLEEALFKLRSAKQEVQGDVFDGVFSQEDEDTFGAEGLDIVKKAAKTAMDKQLKPLQEELRRQEEARIKQLKSQSVAERQAAYQQFLDRLGSLVPEYAELNVDKGFLNWMNGADDFSGAPRGDLFRKAEAAGDVLRVADFFMQYKEQQKPKQKPIPKDVERHVTPVGSGGSSPGPRTQPKTTYYRESDINKFYNDVLKGRYAGRKAVVDATEAAIERAYTENRILRGQ